ncbi:hypothetical protein D3C73_504250 [compost metagenome]
MLHQLDEAFTFFRAEQIGHRYAHVIEEQLGGVLAFLAELVEDASTAETRQVFDLQHDDRHALGAQARVGLAHQQYQVGEVAVGDERLRAVDDVVVTIANGFGLDVLQVGAGARFGHGDCRYHFPGGHFRQPTLFLLFAGVAQQVMRADRTVHVGAQAGGNGAGQFVADDCVVRMAAAAAAVLFRNRRAEHAHLAGLQPGFTVDMLLMGPALFVGHQFFGGKTADRCLEDRQVFG